MHHLVHGRIHAKNSRRPLFTKRNPRERICSCSLTRRGGQMDVGKEIRRLREARGWSQAKLAGASDMGTSGISQIETGARNPSAATLSKIAEALGVEVRDLFPLEQAPLPD